MGIRITVVTVGFALLYSLLGLNMWNIQVKKGELYRARAASQHELAGILTPKRGSIYFTDKDGSRVPAAINKEYPTAYAVPSEIEDPAKVASILSTISNRSEDELVEVLARENDPFEPIAKRANHVFRRTEPSRRLRRAELDKILPSEPDSIAHSWV